MTMKMTKLKPFKYTSRLGLGAIIKGVKSAYTEAVQAMRLRLDRQRTSGSKMRIGSLYWHRREFWR